MGYLDNLHTRLYMWMGFHYVEGEPTMTTEQPKRDVVISTCGPSMLPYWPLMTKLWDLTFTEKQTAEGAKRGNLQGTSWIGEFMPKVQEIGIYNCVASAIAEVNWDRAIRKMRWKAKARDDLTLLVWRTVNEILSTLWLGDKPQSGISIGRAIRYNMLQHIYNAVQQRNDGRWDAVAANWLPGYVMSTLIKIVPAVMALDGLCQQRRVVGMVLHEDVSNDCNFYAQWAKMRGVPSIHIAHGGYGTADQPKEANECNIHIYLEADHICVWNESQRDFMLLGNARPEQVHLTGHGKSDPWATMKVDREYSKTMLGCDPSKPAMLYVSSWVNRIYAAVGTSEIDIDLAFETFLEATKLLPEWTVIVRPHPGTHRWTPQWHREMMKKHGVIGAVYDGEELPAAVQAADVVVDPFCSTVDKEAAIINRPTATRRVSDRNEAFYVLFDMTPESIAQAVKLTRGRENTQEWQEARNKVLYDEFYIVDGHSAERGMEVVRRVIEGGVDGTTGATAKS